MPSTLSSHLLALPDSTLHQIEVHSLLHHLPNIPTLSPLFPALSGLSAAFPSLPTSAHPPGASTRRSKSRPRAAKRAQIASLTTLTAALLERSSVPISRLVDVGAGHAHLAAQLAETLPVPVLALDRDPALLTTAGKLHERHLGESKLSLSQASVAQEHALGLTGSDMVLGLHACGSLGDAIVQTAVREGAAAVALVSCCLQKLSPHADFRPPLSNVASDTASIRELLCVRRDVLGATNRSRGYASEQDLDGRATRYALRKLLRDREHPVARFGDEVNGLSRHALRRGLGAVFEDALRMRGIGGGISSGEVEARMSEARKAYARMRRLTLPRALAGEVLEMLVVLDRAARLQEAFVEVRTCRVWGDAVSVRNLGCVAWR